MRFFQITLHSQFIMKMKSVKATKLILEFTANEFFDSLVSRTSELIKCAHGTLDVIRDMQSLVIFINNLFFEAKKRVIGGP